MAKAFISQKTLMAVLLGSLVGLGATGCKQASEGLTEAKPIEPIVNPDTGTVISAPTLSISQEKNVLLSGGDSSTFTVKATDKNGGILEGVSIRLSINNPLEVGATLTTQADLITNQDGLVTSGIESSGGKIDFVLNHPITVTATAVDNKSNMAINQTAQTLYFNVEGANINLSSNVSSVDRTKTITYDITALDGYDSPIANAPIKLFDTIKNSDIVGSSTTTNSSGQASITINASVLGVTANKAKVIAIASGVNSSTSSEAISTSINLENLAFGSSTAADTEIETAVNVPVVVKGINASDVNGKTVQLFSTLGAITPASSATLSDATLVNGLYQATVDFTLTSASPGTATITASTTDANGETVSISKEQNFISTQADKFLLNIESNVLKANDSTKISVIVKDKNDAPTKNIKVRFGINGTDASGGKLVSSSAITDATGAASVTYIAGSTSTPVDGVSINVSLTDFPSIPAKETSLTVTGNAVQIELAPANKVENAEDIYTTRGYSARVLDSTGRPVVGALVTLRTQASSYLLGRYFEAVDTEGKDVWGRDSIECVAEDKNGNNTLDAGEDTNNNKKLDVTNPTTILLNSGDSTNSAFTDTNGQVNFKLRYFKTHASWVKFKLVATTRVDSTEGTSILDNQTLLQLVADVPAVGSGVLRINEFSPFGTSYDGCNQK